MESRARNPGFYQPRCLRDPAVLTQNARGQSRDDRFIVKQLSAAERRSLKEIAPNYFAYLARAMRRRQPTCLAKIMGVFTVCCLAA